MQIVFAQRSRLFCARAADDDLFKTNDHFKLLLFHSATCAGQKIIMYKVSQTTAIAH